MLEKEILKLPEFQKKINENNKKDVKNYHFKNEDQLYLYIENLPTIQKIFVVQNLLKEMMSIKGLFQENKEKMKEKIDSNSFKYFKDFILIKEKYDYIQSENPEIPLNYILLKNTNEILSFEEEKNKIFIENFFFELRNNNNLVLKIIEKINSHYYEQLSNFMVHFLYENTTSSSYVQDELMAITYLILEKIICQKLPSVITKKNLNKDSVMNNNKKQLFLYYYFKAFTRKPEIRNYLSLIIHDSLLELENINKILNLNIRTIHKNMADEEDEKEKLFSDIKKKNSTVNEGVEKILKGQKYIPQKTMLSLSPSISEEIKNSNKIRHSVGAINSNTKTNKNMDNANFINILDPFFKENDFTQLSLSKMLYHLNNKKRNEIENAYMEYLISLKEEFHENNSNIEIFSSSMISEAFKGTKINQDKITLEDIANNYKDNFNKIIYFMEKILQNIKSNIALLPYSIKCIYFILNKLLGKKYKEKEGHITLFQKFNIKLKFIFNGFILPTLANPLYNGIISDNVLSKSTKDNANLISKIFEKMVSGNLFNIINITSTEEPSLIIFNKYIIEKIPFLFDIITNIDNYIENNFECPLFITDLLSTYNKINDMKRNINYDYFLYNKDDNIKYQCICFSSSDLMMIVNVIDLLDSAIINKSNSNLLKKYRKIFEQRYEDNKEKKKEEYVLISKFSYRESFLNEIKSVTEGHLENYIKAQKNINKGSNHDEEMLRIKKCLIEILIYINKLHKENFNPFIKRKDELFLFHNSNVNKYHKYNKLSLYNDTVFEGDKKYSKNPLTGSFHVSRKISKGLAEDNLEDADFLRDIFPILLSMIKYEIGYNFSNQKLEHIIFCVSYLQIHIKTLPIYYVRNNYSKLFIDIMKDVECLIKSLQNNILNQFYLKIKEGNKLNLITSRYLYKIKNMEKYFCIEYLFNKLKLQDPFELVITERAQTISAKDISSLLTSEVCSIPIFIKKFPDFRKNEREIDDIIEQENSKKIPDILKNYFKDIRNLVKNENIISKYTAEEYLSICYELENYILFRLYEKLFPRLESSKDKFIYKKCCRLSFIKPENYLKDKIKIDENLLKTVIDYINDMDKKYTPVDKIHMFGKAFRILQSFMAFSSGKSEFGIDDTLPLLIYVILKAKPKMINTNFNYCKNYINPELDKKQYGILLMQVGMVIKVIYEMKHTDLIGVTEEQFGKDKEEHPEIKRSKNLQSIYEVNDY